jgi:hypothetical protein
MAPRNVVNISTFIGRSVYLHEGTIWREMCPQLLHCFVFLRNKVILVIFFSPHVFSGYLSYYFCCWMSRIY